MVGGTIPSEDSVNAVPSRAGVRRLLTFTTLYPSHVTPSHGVFVENRLRHLVASGRVESRIVAPVPWFPFSAKFFGRYANYAKVAVRERRHGIEIDHPRYLVLPKIGMLLTPLFLFLSALPAIKRIQAEEGDFDVIDAHYFYPDGIAAAMLGRVLGKPVTITARGTDINLIPRQNLPRRMILWAARMAAGMVTVSEALRREMIALGIPGHRVRTLRNGVDLTMFHPTERAETRAAMSLEGLVLISVGHLVERKGHDLVIGALPDLPGYSLLVAGDGPERGKLQALAATLGVTDRVRFLGAVPHAALAKLYSASDALVLASSREGWPNVLLEAMACGAPVVASNVWGAPELVCDPAAGVLMQERTAGGVASGVRALFAALPTREATRRFAEGYSWDETTEGQIRLFDEIMAARVTRSAPATKSLRRERML